MVCHAFALALAFFAFNKGLPLTIRSTFYPVLGERAWKLPGDIIDVVAVMATIFGLATSLGFGAQQAGSGLHFLFGIKSTIGLQVVIIIPDVGQPAVDSDHILFRHRPGAGFLHL